MPARKNYSPEFKTKVVLAVLSGHQTVARLSSEYGIHPTVIRYWLQQAKDAVSAEFSGKPGKGRN